jgi:hypothetical protein
MKTRRLLHPIGLLAVICAAYPLLHVGAEPVKGEKDWKAERHEEMRPERGPWGPPGGPPGPGGRFGHGRGGEEDGRFFGGMIRLRGEIERLDREAELMAFEKEDLAEKRAESENSARIKRLERMIELRSELLELEKEELLDKVRERATAALKNLQERKERADEDGRGPSKEMLQYFEERVTRFRDAAQDYESLREHIDEFESAGGFGFGEPRSRMIEREMEMLRRRMGILQDELYRMEDRPIEWHSETPPPGPPGRPGDGPPPDHLERRRQFQENLRMGEKPQPEPEPKKK